MNSTWLVICSPKITATFCFDTECKLYLVHWKTRGIPDVIFDQLNKQSLTLSVAGLSDIPGEAMVKLYCSKCQDVYTPKSSRHHHTDGAYFGTGFPHMLFMVHPEYRPKRPANQFVPRYAFCSSQIPLFLIFKISFLSVISNRSDYFFLVSR